MCLYNNRDYQTNNKTKKNKYLDINYFNLAESFYNQFNGPELADFSWDNKKLGSQIVLYEITGSNAYKNTIRLDSKKINLLIVIELQNSNNIFLNPFAGQTLKL